MTTRIYINVSRDVHHPVSTEDVKHISAVAALIERRLVHALDVQPSHSILELRGLGKELWQQIDSTAYLDQERDSWDG